MKKSVKIALFFLAIFVIILVGIGVVFLNDSLRFKISYEYINFIEYDNGKKIKTTIPFDNRIDYISEKELLSLLEEGTGVLYFGYNTCPWCRNVAPILINAVTDNEIDTIYYADIHKLDISSIRDDLYEYLDPYLEEREGHKVLAVPDIYFIKEGQIIGHHLGSVESYINAYQEMTDDQKLELYSIYDIYIKELIS